MKKLFILLFGLMILSCNPKVIDNIDKGDKMLTTMNGKYSIAQFDSMCLADTLPRSLGEWQRFGAKDYESHQRHIYPERKEDSHQIIQPFFHS